MSKPNRAHPLVSRIGAMLLAAGALQASSVQAQTLDPALPHELPVGLARNVPALPNEPRLAWQARLNEPLAGPPVADQSGRLILAHASGTLASLDARGRATFLSRTGAPALTGPVSLAGKGYLVLTAESEAVVVSPGGQLRSRVKLPFRELESTLLVEATRDGGALVAAGSRFARLGPAGNIAYAGQTRESLRGALEWRGLTLLVERTGRVLARAHAGDPYELASFPKPVSAVTAGGDRLLAIVAGRELVALDLSSKRTTTLYTDPSMALTELVALPDGGTRFLADSGTLVGTDGKGRETLRAVLRVQTVPDAHSALAVDDRGAVLVALAGLDLTLVTTAGDSKQLAGTACPDPLPPVALGKLWVATCRSGLAFAVSDKAR